MDVAVSENYGTDFYAIFCEMILVIKGRFSAIKIFDPINKEKVRGPQCLGDFFFFESTFAQTSTF